MEGESSGGSVSNFLTIGTLVINLDQVVLFDLDAQQPRDGRGLVECISIQYASGWGVQVWHDTPEYESLYDYLRALGQPMDKLSSSEDLAGCPLCGLLHNFGQNTQYPR